MNHVYTTFCMFDFGIIGECECEISFTYDPKSEELEISSVKCDGVDITNLAADAISDHPAFEEAASEAYNDANEE